MADLEFEPCRDPEGPRLTNERLAAGGFEPEGPVPPAPLRVQAGDTRFSPARPDVSWTGVFIEPPPTVLGLRIWSDTREFEVTVDDDGAEQGSPVPVSMFDIEKIIRMLLHQSGLAVETLGAGRRQIPERWADAGFQPRRAVEWGVTEDILQHYRDAAAPFLQDGDDMLDPGLVSRGEWLHRTRLLLTGLALQEGRVGVDFDYLLETTATDSLSDTVAAVVDGAEGAREALVSAAAPQARELVEEDSEVLPDSPDGYDELDAWLVELRQDDFVDSRRS